MKKITSLLNTIWTIVTLPFRALIVLVFAPFAIAIALEDDMKREYAMALDCGFAKDYKDFCARYYEWERMKQHI